jgi:hypothetical protein
MQLLDLIVPYITGDSVIVSHGFIVAFIVTLMFKWKLFEKWSFYFKLKDICYFCWCFWLSVPFCTSLIDLIVCTIVAKLIITINIGV